MKQRSGNSFWLDTSTDPGYPALDRNLVVDAVVIGGGLAGLNAAYLLKKAGLKVAVLEKERVAAGVTGHTTGKVTSQHGLIYSKLIETRGEAVARAYGEANQAAISQIRQNIADESIDCDWQADDNYVFTDQAAQVGELQQEAAVARTLGLPASFQTASPLPFDIKGAVRFSGQGKLHARNYALGLAKAINANDSYVFERTAAGRITDGKLPTVRTRRGTVTAKYVIIATNVPYPVVAHGLYCGYEYPMQSYIVAVRYDGNLRGMYITPHQPLFSVLPVKHGAEQLLLIGGQSHIPYLGGRAEKHYAELERYARDRFGLSDIVYRWWAFDYLAYDQTPFVGPLYPNSKNVYVTTAYAKWGLTNTAASAVILRDLIMGKPNRWAEAFRSNRASAVKAIPGLLFGRN